MVPSIRVQSAALPLDTWMHKYRKNGRRNKQDPATTTFMDTQLLRERAAFVDGTCHGKETRNRLKDRRGLGPAKGEGME
eukprot:329322-Amphidinium_carterae.1